MFGPPPRRQQQHASSSQLVTRTQSNNGTDLHSTRRSTTPPSGRIHPSQQVSHHTGPFTQQPSSLYVTHSHQQHAVGPHSIHPVASNHANDTGHVIRSTYETINGTDRRHFDDDDTAEQYGGRRSVSAFLANVMGEPADEGRMEHPLPPTYPAAASPPADPASGIIFIADGIEGLDSIYSRVGDILPTTSSSYDYPPYATHRHDHHRHNSQAVVDNTRRDLSPTRPSASSGRVSSTRGAAVNTPTRAALRVAAAERSIHQQQQHSHHQQRKAFTPTRQPVAGGGGRMNEAAGGHAMMADAIAYPQHPPTPSKSHLMLQQREIIEHLAAHARQEEARASAMGEAYDSLVLLYRGCIHMPLDVLVFSEEAARATLEETLLGSHWNTLRHLSDHMRCLLEQTVEVADRFERARADAVASAITDTERECQSLMEAAISAQQEVMAQTIAEKDAAHANQIATMEAAISRLTDAVAGVSSEKAMVEDALTDMIRTERIKISSRVSVGLQTPSDVGQLVKAVGLLESGKLSLDTITTTHQLNEVSANTIRTADLRSRSALEMLAESPQPSRPSSMEQQQQPVGMKDDTSPASSSRAGHQQPPTEAMLIKAYRAYDVAQRSVGTSTATQHTSVVGAGGSVGFSTPSGADASGSASSSLIAALNPAERRCVFEAEWDSYRHDKHAERGTSPMPPPVRTSVGTAMDGTSVRSTGVETDPPQKRQAAGVQTDTVTFAEDEPPRNIFERGLWTAQPNDLSIASGYGAYRGVADRGSTFLPRLSSSAVPLRSDSAATTDDDFVVYHHSHLNNDIASNNIASMRNQHVSQHLQLGAAAGRVPRSHRPNSTAPPSPDRPPALTNKNGEEEDPMPPIPEVKKEVHTIECQTDLSYDAIVTTAEHSAALKEEHERLKAIAETAIAALKEKARAAADATALMHEQQRAALEAADDERRALQGNVHDKQHTIDTLKKEAKRLEHSLNTANKERDNAKAHYARIKGDTDLHRRAAHNALVQAAASRMATEQCLVEKEALQEAFLQCRWQLSEIEEALRVAGLGAAGGGSVSRSTSNINQAATRSAANSTTASGVTTPLSDPLTTIHVPATNSTKTSLLTTSSLPIAVVEKLLKEQLLAEQQAHMASLNRIAKVRCEEVLLHEFIDATMVPTLAGGSGEEEEGVESRSSSVGSTATTTNDFLLSNVPKEADEVLATNTGKAALVADLLAQMGDSYNAIDAAMHLFQQQLFFAELREAERELRACLDENIVFRVGLAKGDYTVGVSGGVGSGAGPKQPNAGSNANTNISHQLMPVAAASKAAESLGRKLHAALIGKVHKILDRDASPFAVQSMLTRKGRGVEEEHSQGQRQGFGTDRSTPSERPVVMGGTTTPARRGGFGDESRYRSPPMSPAGAFRSPPPPVHRSNTPTQRRVSIRQPTAAAINSYKFPPTTTSSGRAASVVHIDEVSPRRTSLYTQQARQQQQSPSHFASSATKAKTATLPTRTPTMVPNVYSNTANPTKPCATVVVADDDGDNHDRGDRHEEEDVSVSALSRIATGSSPISPSSAGGGALRRPPSQPPAARSVAPPQPTVPSSATASRSGSKLTVDGGSGTTQQQGASQRGASGAAAGMSFSRSAPATTTPTPTISRRQSPLGSRRPSLNC